MALSRTDINALAVRLGNIPSSYTGIDADSYTAIQIIASMRDWSELYRTSTITTTATDGDIAYALASNVDKIEQMRITSPLSYSRVLEQQDKRIMRDMIPNKLLPGRCPPSRWYFVESTIDATSNAETKNVTFDYRPDQAYIITYSYKANPPLLTDPTARPFFDDNYHHIIAYYDVWKYAERSADQAQNPIYWRGEWENGIKQLLAGYESKSTLPLPVPGPGDLY